MTQRLSKLAEYLVNDNFEMAVELHQQFDPRRALDESEEVQLLLAKAYYLSQKYSRASELAGRVKNSRNIKISYEAHLLEFKAYYLEGTNRGEIL